MNETYIGGVQKNKKNSQRRNPAVVPIIDGKRSIGPQYDKVSVLSLVDAETGEVRSKVIPDVTGATLRKAIAEQADLAHTELVTDEWSGYKSIAGEFLAHHTVNHKQDEYVRYEDDGRTITTNQAEGYFSQLKRSLDGTHHHVSTAHLPRYLAQFDYLYSTRKLSDTARLNRLMGQVGGRRLTYKRTTTR